MSGANARYIATIESVSSCPVNCEMCPVSRTDIPQPKARLMPLDVAGAVAARLRHEFDVKFVAWGNWGEPLVHPEIVQLIQAFGRVGLKNQFLSSSLSAKFDIEGLAHSGLRQLDISISGMTAEVYNVGHKNGRWDLIEENMRKVAEVRRAGAMHLNVDIRWHRYRHNEHQLAAAAEWAKGFGFGFKPYYAHVGGIDALHDLDAGTLPESKVNYIRESVFVEHIDALMAVHEGETSCPMDRNLIIHPDGSLLHCCALMASHQSGIDFLSLPKESIVGFKKKPNSFCGECLEKGWSGFTHTGKTDVEVAEAHQILRQRQTAPAHS